MGRDVASSHFQKQDFTLFERRLADESALLAQWFEQNHFSDRPPVAGFEMEAWLLDGNHDPLPNNKAFLAALNNELVTPELARFNVEINGTPQPLIGRALRNMEQELLGTCGQCHNTAKAMNADLLMIGILPTVTEEMLTIANMSDMMRYRALNEQVLRLRKGRPLMLDIQGKEHLRTSHLDVMTEAAATSYQIHIQVPQDMAVRLYNASIAVSAAMVAVSANSPYFMGKDLWDETRIPVFEQSVDVGEQFVEGGVGRVSFGSGYAKHSLLECFEENHNSFPVLLPACFDEAPEEMSHLRLHNGTIWRWNRPLIGFDDDGRPHLRIEHRVVAAGPSVIDSIANSAFYYGLVYELASRPEPIESCLPFAVARDSFYAAAKQGLRASVSWINGQKGPVQILLHEHLLDIARSGLERLEINRDDITDYLGIIEARVRTSRNGAGWQRNYVAKHGADMQALTSCYLQRQSSGLPVHDWLL